MHGEVKRKTIIYSLVNGKQSEYAQNHVPDWHDKLEDLQDYSDCDLQNEQSSESEQCEEWMILADFSHSNNSTDPEVSSLYTNNSKKQTYIYQPLSNPDDNININTFSNMQALAYNLVKQHFESPQIGRAHV